MQREATASFGDGINKGFYINAYTTKHCPTMDGVLEEMRRGLERLEQTREAEQERLKANLRTGDPQRAGELTRDQAKALKGKSKFGEALNVLKRLSASYRRCYWKSGSEMLFPILFGHLTFASHRCWTVFIKKGVFLSAEAWRRAHGQAVRHAALRDGGGEVLQYIRTGMDPYPMMGWKRCQVEEGGPPVYEGPNGASPGPEDHELPGLRYVGLSH